MSQQKPNITQDDKRYMAAAIRLGRWHLAQTGTNPSVSTLIVKDLGHGPVIVGRGITGIGGRPHAEAGALTQAGDHAKGATAYVTLEPCAHHGRTPPCALALVDAGVSRVVCALTDPDDRVSGAGFKILQDAGIEVVPDCEADAAQNVLGPYLNRSQSKRTQVTLKFAVSADGMIGREGEGMVAITGAQALAQSHILRAEHDAILVGIGTAIADDPSLTCRLPGMEGRSPARIVLDTHARLPATSKLVETVHQAPLYIATAEPQSDNAKALAAAGAQIIACELFEGRIALPELMEDLAALGFTRALVEGGAAVAEALLSENLVERIALFESDVIVGESKGILCPFNKSSLPDGFKCQNEYIFGKDRYYEIGRS